MMKITHRSIVFSTNTIFRCSVASHSSSPQFFVPIFLLPTNPQPFPRPHRSQQATFEDNADLVAVAKRAAGGESFPDYFEVARSMPEETEITVYQEPVREPSKPMIPYGRICCTTISYRSVVHTPCCCHSEYLLPKRPFLGRHTTPLAHVEEMPRIDALLLRQLIIVACRHTATNSCLSGSHMVRTRAEVTCSIALVMMLLCCCLTP